MTKKLLTTKKGKKGKKNNMLVYAVAGGGVLALLYFMRGKQGSNGTGILALETSQRFAALEQLMADWMKTMEDYLYGTQDTDTYTAPYSVKKKSKKSTSSAFIPPPSNGSNADAATQALLDAMGYGLGTDLWIWEAALGLPSPVATPTVFTPEQVLELTGGEGLYNEQLEETGGGGGGTLGSVAM